jgi:acetyl esterase/lipase
MQHFSISYTDGADITCCLLNDRPSRNPDQSPRPGVVLVPGGGYHCVVDHEQECIAVQFLAKGYHVFILNYTVNEDGSRPLHSLPLEQLARAMAFIRGHAREWHLDPGRLALAGFSAGGHLAGSLAVHWHREWLKERTALSPERIRPDALILAYPVTTTGPFAHRGSIDHLLGPDATEEELHLYSLEEQVTAHVPPVFLWHTQEDEFVPVMGSLLFAQACIRENVPLELHIYPENRHGLSLAIKETAWEDPASVDPHIAGWFSLCTEWLELIWK